jgi:hypothetical protein
MLASELTYFHAALYHSRCAFSDVYAFLERTEKLFNARGGGAESARRVAESREEKVRGKRDIKTDKEALEILLARDLARIAQHIDESLEIDVDEDQLQADLQFYLNELRQLGVDLPAPRLNVVDRFPKPFNKYDWTAFSPDAQDEAKYGIPKGIYLLRKKIRPFYSTALVAHELIHTIPAQAKPDLLAMGLEEGLADLVGGLYLAQRRLNTDLAVNVYVYGRNAVGGSHIWNLYKDHTRQAAALFTKFGLRGILALLEQGRGAIHAAERKMLLGKFEEIDLPEGNRDTTLSDMLTFNLSAFLPHYTMSPIERLLVDAVEEGKSVSDVAEDARVRLSVARKALSALTTRTSLFVLEGDCIGYSNVSFYRQTEEEGAFPILRYRLDCV